MALVLILVAGLEAILIAAGTTNSGNDSGHNVGAS